MNMNMHEDTVNAPEAQPTTMNSTWQRAARNVLRTRPDPHAPMTLDLARRLLTTAESPWAPAPLRMVMVPPEGPLHTAFTVCLLPMAPNDELLATCIGLDLRASTGWDVRVTPQYPPSSIGLWEPPACSRPMLVVEDLVVTGYDTMTKITGEVLTATDDAERYFTGDFDQMKLMLARAMIQTVEGQQLVANDRARRTIKTIIPRTVQA